jgi:mannose-1-phosphate guanylyltransferase
MANGARITPVILSGGAGTRLWPLSRPERPKQLLALTGPETMLQMTLRRAADPALFGPPILVASAAHAGEIEAQLAQIGASAAALILEPHPRNTAPAIALAALSAAADTVLLVMPSDHVVRDGHAFRAAVEAARPLAADGWLVTFGIAPDRAETGYGYIRRGELLSPSSFRVDRFVEKPDLAAAQAYLADGRHDWNGGIFAMRANAYLEALDEHAPNILAACRAAMAGAVRDGPRLSPEAASFAASPSQSIDYAVMEKAERVAVVPVDMGWSDVGSWEALHQLQPKDERGNAAVGDVLVIDSDDCLVQSDGPRVVAIGVRDLVIVATGDTVLVVPREQSQRVKEAVEALKARGRGAPKN